MKILVCGNDLPAAETAVAAVYDAGGVPIGPVGNALRALGLADEERPDVAVVDLSAIDGATGVWLAGNFVERGIGLICLTDSGTEPQLARWRPVMVDKPAARVDLVESLVALSRSGRARSRSARQDAGSILPATR